MDRGIELRKIHRLIPWQNGKPLGWLCPALVCAAVILWLISASMAVAHPARQAISSDTFWQQVDQTIAWLDTNPMPNDEAWQAEASRWEKIREVSLSDQTTMQVDTSYIVQMLRAKSPDRAEISTYLSNLKAAQSLTTAVGGESETKRLNEILARPEFRYNTGEQNFIQKILQWVLDMFGRLLDLLFGDMKAEFSIPPDITIAISLLVITLVLAFVFRDTLRNLFTEAELAEDAVGEGEILSARLANQKAHALSSGGDYRHALRYLYLSALLLLDERGLLRYNRAQTNREYLRQVRSRPDLSEHLKVVVETFDRVWYGYQPMDETSYAQYAEHVTALEETRQ